MQNFIEKETVVEFFNWLFEKNFSEEEIEAEEDESLEDYEDKHIYYTPEISALFQTPAMQRLGRISQLGTLMSENQNCIHNRLEHSKGTYNRKLKELIHLCNNVDGYKEYIEQHGMKVYLIAELVKAAMHDIGHLPLSHVIEIQIINNRGFHERMGKRIVLEDEKIRSTII